MKAEHDVGLGVVRADVLGAGESLFEEAEGVGAGLAVGLPVGDGDGADAGQNEHPSADEDAQGEASSPIFPEEEREDADQQDEAAEHLEDKEGEEGAKLIGIAVYALDHLTGGVLVVVGHVERKGVLGEVLADVIRGGPADALGEIGGEDLHDLLDHGDDDEEDGGGGEPFERAALLGLVDEVPDDLGQDELEAESGEQQDAECDDPRKLGEHVPSEQAAVFPRLDGYLRFSECGGQVHGERK